MSIAKKYVEVIARYKEISLVGSIVSLLQWDHNVNLPKKGLPQRSEQLAYLEGHMHRRLTDPTFVAAVNETAAAADELDTDGRVNIREIKRAVDRAVKVPAELVEQISHHDSMAQGVWFEARRDSNFAQFAPLLEKTVELRKQRAVCLGFADHPYDAMLDDHEPYATEASIEVLLDDLKQRLVPFMHRILGAKAYGDERIVGKDYPIDKQREFGLRVIRQFGYDMDGGHQAIAPHPFCSGTKGDVRITTRFFPDDPRPSLTGLMHEGGHAIYEQGLLDKHLGAPLGEACSLGVHESQSRFWENIIGRSRPFWKHYWPAYRKVFSAQLAGISLTDWHRMMNIVRPSLIRVEADEATYNLHIIIRFEIERALVRDEVAVADLPELWNRKMKEYLGIAVPNDAAGVLQDIHWSLGALGYFPTYTIGNLYAAQLWEKLRADEPAIEDAIARGEFRPVLDWLRKKIHVHGKRYRGDELIKRATGKKPSAVPLMNYLAEKFGPLYKL